MFLGEEDKSIIVELLVNELEPKFIYLFGSYARGESRMDSDVDLAVYMDKKIWR